MSADKSSEKGLRHFGTSGLRASEYLSLQLWFSFELTKAKPSDLTVLDYPLAVVRINFRLRESGTFPTFTTSTHLLNDQNMNTRIYRHVYPTFDGTDVLWTLGLWESLILNTMTLFRITEPLNMKAHRSNDPYSIDRSMTVLHSGTSEIRGFLHSLPL
jgi:hypothetical protein